MSSFRREVGFRSFCIVPQGALLPNTSPPNPWTFSFVFFFTHSPVCTMFTYPLCKFSGYGLRWSLFSHHCASRPVRPLRPFLTVVFRIWNPFVLFPPKLFSSPFPPPESYGDRSSSTSKDGLLLRYSSLSALPLPSPFLAPCLSPGFAGCLFFLSARKAHIDALRNSSFLFVNWCLYIRSRDSESPQIASSRPTLRLLVLRWGSPLP